MSDPQRSPEKPTDEWVTGDEPMTGPQQSYLETLAREAGEEVPPDLTKAQASDMIDRLQAATGRGQPSSSTPTPSPTPSCRSTTRARPSSAAPSRADRRLGQDQLAQAEAHDEQAAEAVEEVLLALHERARAVAVEDPDGDHGREPVEGVQPGRLRGRRGR